MNKDVALAVDYALNKGFQIHPGALNLLESVRAEDLRQLIKEVVKKKTRQNVFLINQDDLESVLGIKYEDELTNDLKIIFDPTSKIASAEGVEGYAALFINRYNKLKKIISGRSEAKGLKSIKRVREERGNDSVYVCGLVTSKSLERNSAKITVEDDTESLECLIFDDELKKKMNGLLMEQFVMINVVLGKNGRHIAKDIVVPDVAERQSGRSESEIFALFLSDLHIGSKYFLEDEFNNLISWIRSNDSIARRIGFIVIGGDLVDGVGIYPNQDKELLYPSIEEQLSCVEKNLSKIPESIQIIIIPGNHDPGRRALPQPAIPRKYNPGLWNRKNFHMVGNPSMISLNGVKVLMFHGQSIDDVVKVTPGLSYAEPVNVMRELLRVRHLCPIYGGNTPIAPEIEDVMVIEDVPDIFHVGHVHVMGVGSYRGTLLVNSGTWQGQTPFQASVGITPTPGIAILVNLKTFECRIKEF